MNAGSGAPRETALAEQPVAGISDLVAFLRAGETPRAAWRVGTEHEKMGLRSADLRPVPYEGEAGIAHLLREIAARDGWQPIFEAEQLIGLRKANASITLEPGGQLELSGAPLRTIHQTCDELHRHLDLLRRVSAPLDLLWLSLGASPLHDVADASPMPKARYDIMRRYLPTRAKHPLEMMYLTATVQANFDFEDEADMARKMRMAMAVTPIVSALFANSPFHCGKESGFVSRRLHIWRHTDPDRCGLLPFVFEPGFGYQRYVEWAISVPMFYIVRGDLYLPMDGQSFDTFMRRGFQGHHATLEDFNLHLTTLFPEVRCKQFIEVRGADAVGPELICALPALWKGLFYDDAALAAAWELAAKWPFEERERALVAVAREGLAARIAGQPALALARELHAIAVEGLSRIAHRGGEHADERSFLEPVAELLESGASPGEQLLARWQSEFNRHDMRQLVEHVRY